MMWKSPDNDPITNNNTENSESIRGSLNMHNTHREDPGHMQYTEGRPRTLGAQYGKARYRRRDSLPRSWQRSMQHFRDESFHKAAIHNKKYKRRTLELAKCQRTLPLETAPANPTILGRNTQIELQMCTSNATASIKTDHSRATTSNEKQQQVLMQKPWSYDTNNGIHSY